MKIHAFTVQENSNLRVLREQWLECYLYTKIHEIFFASFPSELYEWIEKLADSQERWKLNNHIVWTLELVHRLQALEYKITHVVDHWLDRIIGGFITEFAVDTSVSYSAAE